ncbi:outer membrane protein transport protein [Vibrio sp. D404a]|uniref:OmpP1/FadL family transporter n=1 Tax=unclassified Vibrio TaxID=2614977 RepID=UPI00255591F5|nr:MULTISPECIES: outer membrane protein transport protein [unclassified Vibrio]MDK9735701.1 outer membrane protein transport protein [Vibrio sp. D404a]MDK9798617.1 outer membrane protein transport protein [Vibrio sp. D449a]
MKLTRTAMIVSALFATGAHAGGITLPEIATFDSVSSAGIANATNRTDASAMATSPAGLASVKDYSFSVGASFLDAASAHSGYLYNPESDKYDIYTTTRGKKRKLIPSAAYAKRINDQVVLGVSVHGEGGLGLDYSNGLMGGGIYDEQAVEFINFNFGGSYQVNDKFTLGAAVIAQYMEAEIKTNDVAGLGRVNADDNSVEPTFMLSAMYDFTPDTYIAVNYKHAAKHKIHLQGVGDKEFKYPSILTVGLSHQFDENWGIKLQTGFEEWKEYGKGDKIVGIKDGREMNNVYHLGAAVNYTDGNMKYQAGARWDSKSMNASDAESDLPLVEQYAIGAGLEYTMSNGHRVGLAYEYRDLGTPTVAYDFGIIDYQGKMTSHRLHWLSLSYAY